MEEDICPHQTSFASLTLPRAFGPGRVVSLKTLPGLALLARGRVKIFDFGEGVNINKKL